MTQTAAYITMSFSEEAVNETVEVLSCGFDLSYNQRVSCLRSVSDEASRHINGGHRACRSGYTNTVEVK